jgi:hypothetical protein
MKTNFNIIKEIIRHGAELIRKEVKEVRVDTTSPGKEYHLSNRSQVL